MLLLDKESDIILNEDQLTEEFVLGCKTEEKIGVESEKLLVYKNSLRAVKYNDVVKILENFDSEKWSKIYDGETIIGLKSDIGTISLEPGSQIEISLIPYKDLNEITVKLQEFYKEVSIYAEKVGAMIFDSGIQPISTYNDIEVIPKRRYYYMTKYLPEKGLEPFIMMRETAGIQANIDYKSEEDAIKKLSLALKMSPIISAIYANSPVRNSKLTGFKSFRANSWLNVDEERCGYISKKLFDKNIDFTFKDYVDILLDIPMIFIKRGDLYYYAPLTFRDFMKNGYMGLNAKISDWQTHISLYFPDVRLKSYIEIRNHDAQNSQMTFSVPAFWKGIIYNSDAMEEVNKILSEFSFEEFMQLRKDSPKYGINAKLGKFCILDFIKEFFDISYSNLKENNEEKYLDIVREYIKLKRVPADQIIDLYSKKAG